ncbi:dephospho-CoA kinase [Phnomibacter ginsenosidimutans]|uniref:Dephospho-CoA kinase n=1 Tax=Phnomibacter ginsenosidimutans TaxID=2676868 RepID=A0A6I6GLA7_9BACT|nr:dephospho-CoA kinase [Phnomibacter ginsenosidimutans]QGW27692.1 dephospho-CoA kinase [Phnomibacter ginsenosidimutans]
MLRVGITGGIGSGKSVVARIFETLGIPVYYSDAEAKRLMNTDATLRTNIIAAFGPEAYNEAGLNRSWLAAQAFQQPEKTQLLNSIVHPAVIAHGKQWLEQQQTAYAIKEAALFFESGSATDIDFMIGVYAPQALRIQRVMQRDGLGRQEVLTRMSRQIEETVKMKLCDAVIQNNEQEMLIPQVLQLHQQLLAMAEKNSTN